ncbi:MAG: LysM peptidoglycan-binding domain-containing protein [Pseudomonadota bacterium]
MGLLDFVRDVGRQVFNSDAEAAQMIRQDLDIQLSGIENLEVEFDDGVATICGDCVNQSTRDTAVLIVGNIKGVERVVADDLRVPAPAELPTPTAESAPGAAPAAAEEKAEVYEIVSGDTLGGIAKRYYGNAGAYMRIFEANRGIIEDPNRIYPGQKIRIPLDD